MKYCVDCKHFSPYRRFSALGVEIPEECIVSGVEDPVYGRIKPFESPRHYRAFPSPIPNKCGPEAKHWEAK